MAALTEIVCPMRSMGSGTIISALIESTQKTGQHLALVDAANSFDPDGLPTEQLAALLWVQCSGYEHAMKSLDLLLRDGNLPLVILDLTLCPEREVRAIPSTFWYRLQRVTEGNGSVALIFTPTPIVASATCTLRLTRRFELAALDLLRDQLTAGLQMEAVRTRVSARSSREFHAPGLAVG